MLDVELREIEAFLTLADELHFGRTAERLNLTPSRISQIIRTLETRLGGALFDRTSRRVRLTPLGEKFQQSVGPVFEALDTAVADARQVTRRVAGTLRLGMYTPINGGPHLVEIVKTFGSRYPACRVEVVDTGLDVDLLDWLRAGRVDALATRLPIHHPDVTIGPLLSREGRIVNVATDHPLAAQPSVTLEDLADYTTPDIVTLPREAMDAFIPPTTPSGRPLPRRPVRALTDAITLIALGEIVHPTVASFVHFHSHPGITQVPLTDLPPSETALVWLTKHRTPNIQAFADVASTVIQAHGGL